MHGWLKKTLWILTFASLPLTGHALHAASTSGGTPLIKQGKAALPIVIGNGRSLEQAKHWQQADLNVIADEKAAAASRVERAAGTLAQYLGLIGDTTFNIEAGDGKSGIAVGVFTDFPELNLADRFNPSDRLRQEEYLLRSTPQGLQIIAASEIGLEDAIWDVLHRLGYRQFFPGKTWEIIPNATELSLAVDQFETPDFYSRLIWYGGGVQDHNKDAYRAWSERNRAVAGLRVNTSHEYWKIVSRNKEVFAAHPEYYASVKGKRDTSSHSKFDVSNPGLRDIVVKDGIQWFKDNPDEISKSMDPNDMGGWDDTEAAKSIGSPTDQALTLANLVARGATEHFKEDKFVGIYAYLFHQAPPNIKPDPNVIVSFATRFVTPGTTVEKIMQGWKEKGLKNAGIREYYGVQYFDNNLPVYSIQGTSIDYVRESIPEYYRMGARFFTAESNDQWGMLGLGHYIASRLLWDVEEAGKVDAIVDEFLTLSFGPAKAPMSRFYGLLNGKDRPLLNDANATGKLYSYLGEARTLARDDNAILARIDDLILFVRGMELHAFYIQQTEAEPAQAAFEEDTRFAYRSRNTLLTSITAYVMNWTKYSNPKVAIPANARWKIPEGPKNPWKNSDPFTQDEITTILNEGIARYKDQAEAQYLPVNIDAKPSGLSKSVGIRGSANQYLVYATEKEKVDIETSIRLMHFSYGPAYTVIAPSGKVVLTGRLPIEQTTHIQWTASETGTYRVMMEATPNAVNVRSANRLSFVVQNNRGTTGRIGVVKPRTVVYFWVPANSSDAAVEVGGQGDGEKVQAWLIDPAGKVVAHQDQISGSKPHVFQIPVTDQAQGQIWGLKLDAPSSGSFEDVTLILSGAIPPVLSLDPASLLRPQN